MSLRDIKKAILQEMDKITENKSHIRQLENEVKDLSQTKKSHVVTDSNPSSDMEYKVRYESQASINRQLLKEVVMLRKNKDIEKKNLKKGKGPISDEDEYLGAKGKKLMIRLHREKINLESLVRDYEWKLDQEARTYHKVSDRCTQMVSDIQRATGAKTTGVSTTSAATKRRNSVDKVATVNIKKKNASKISTFKGPALPDIEEKKK